MKKLFKYWWRDFLFDIFGIYLPAASVAIFLMIAVTYWPSYAWESTAIYVLVLVIFINIRISKSK